MKKTLKVSSQTIDEAICELHTLRDMLRWGLSQLRMAGVYCGHGTDNAWDETVCLVLQALHLGPELNDQFLDVHLTSGERSCIAQLVAKRINKRMPAAYLTHQAWFAGLSFYVDSRVLIPRSPIAELIARAFSPWVKDDSVHSILDLCTGSGCIAIACAYAFPEATVDASDISRDALAVAKINVDQHHLAEQVQLIHSDLFSALSDKKYDLIVTNPPYVTEKEMALLPLEYQHEPSIGLTAGGDGLDYITRILQAASKHLNPRGILIGEVGNAEAALIRRYPKLPFTWLDFQRGGGGVFLLTLEQLEQANLS